MSAKEAADLLKVSRTTLQRLINENRIKPIETETSPLLKRPRRLMFRRSDVEALLNTPKS